MTVPLHAQHVAALVPRDSIAARLRELHRIHTPEGIEDVAEPDVNGSKQWISIRGLNRANPVLLVPHGGPGSALTGVTWAYRKPWEDSFSVVNWEQRGVGKNFSAADSARLGPTLSPEQLAQGAAVVVAHLRQRLGPRKVVAMGFSYGTSIGPRLVEMHPEWSSVVDGRDGERPHIVDRLDVPVVILGGRYDLMTTYRGARACFEALDTPQQQFITFERSAHLIMLEEPGRFLVTLVNTVLPLAGGSPESPHREARKAAVARGVVQPGHRRRRQGGPPDVCCAQAPHAVGYCRRAFSVVASGARTRHDCTLAAERRRQSDQRRWEIT